MITDHLAVASSDQPIEQQGAAVATDWKAIATVLAQRCLFAVESLNATGPGLLLNTKDGTTQHWRDYIADALDMIPGMTVDRESMNILHLPRNRRAKAFRELQAFRSRQTIEKPLAQTGGGS